MTTEYNIDHDGINCRWRVWWLDGSGRTRKQEFDSREAAERWARVVRRVVAERCPKR